MERNAALFFLFLKDCYITMFGILLHSIENEVLLQMIDLSDGDKRFLCRSMLLFARIVALCYVICHK